MSIKKIVPGLLFAGLLAGGAAYVAFMENEPAPPTRAWGNVDTRQVSLAFEGSGRIAELTVEEGERVAAGDLLGKLDTTALQIERRQAEANLRALDAAARMAEEGYRAEDIERARKEVSALAAQRESARRTYERQKGLSQTGATSRQLLEDARYAETALARQLEGARANLHALEAGPRPQEVESARAQADAAAAAVERLTDQIDRAALLYAPVSGIVRSRLAEPGDMASPARTVFQLSIVDPKWVRAYVTERQLAYVKEGAPARVSTDTTEPMEGTVAFVSSTAEFTPKSVQTEELRTLLVYEVKVSVPDPENRLRLGQPVTVDFPDGTTGTTGAPSNASSASNTSND